MVTDTGGEPDWHGDYVEPPTHILHVKDRDGFTADRQGPCEFCGGSIWQWRHNRNSECWLDIDGIGPWEGWR